MGASAFTPAFIQCVLLWLCMPIYAQYVGTTCTSIIMCHHHPIHSSIHPCAMLYDQQDEKDHGLEAYARRTGKYTLTFRLMRNRFEQTSPSFVYILHCAHTSFSQQCARNTQCER